MITSFYAALLGLMMVALSINVIKRRGVISVALGDKEDFELKRRIRAQANFAEYAPLFIILLALLEIQSFPAYIVHAAGLIFVLGRYSHAYSMLKGEHYVDGKLVGSLKWRITGMICTFSMIGGISIALLVQSLLKILSVE